MRNCFLHAGTPKTGSTTIQSFLEAARDRLAARGLDVAAAPGLDVAATGRALAKALASERDPAAPRSKPWTWLDRHLAETQTDLCVSHEIFATALSDAGKFSFVEGFFIRRGVTLTVLAYVRDVVGRINAAYTQHAKNLRMAEEFDAWALAITPDTVEKFSPLRTFAPVMASPGVRFVARPFDIVRERIVADFLDEIGHGDVDRASGRASLVLNASPGPKAIAAAVAIRRALDAKGVDQDGRAPYRVAYRERLAASGWAERAFFGFSPERARETAARFAAEYDAFSEEVWGRPWAEASPVAARPRNVLDPSNAQDAENVAAFTREILRVETPGPLARLLKVVWRR